MICPVDSVHGDLYAKKVIICKIFQIDPQVKMLYNKHIRRIVRTVLFYRNSLIL